MPSIKHLRFISIGPPVAFSARARRLNTQRLMTHDFRLPTSDAQRMDCREHKLVVLLKRSVKVG